MTYVEEVKVPGFLFGADPELFVLDETGRPVSAEGLLPGTKNDPFPVEDGAIQVDGMAAEFNIDPVSNFEDFNTKIVSVMGQLRRMLPKGYSLSAVPAVEFDEEVWDSSPAIAKMLGCSADFHAWTGRISPPPKASGRPRLRTAAGHLHIGWTDDADLGDENHTRNCRGLVKQLDWYLGAWSLQKDPDPTRRLLYGKAGAMRYKPYGVEYRVLSNFWLKDKDSRRMVWNRMARAINNMSTCFYPGRPSYEGFNERVIRSINTSQRDAGLEYMFRNPLIIL